MEPAKALLRMLNVTGASGGGIDHGILLQSLRDFVA
jgi:hypothetical protein